MRRQFIAALILVLPGFSGGAAAESAEARGRAIFAERDRLDAGFVDQQVDMEMTLRSPDGRTSQRRVRLQQREGPAGEGDKALLIFEAPPDIAGTALLTHEALGAADDAQWLYLPAYKRVKRVAAQDRSGRFVGTEFSYEDLAGDRVEDFDYRFLGEERADGRRMLRVERVPLNRGSEYSRQETWVDAENGQVVRALLYDRKGRHIKTFEATDWVRHEGRFWRPHSMTMTHVPSGRSTSLKASDYRFGTGLPEERFSASTLR